MMGAPIIVSGHKYLGEMSPSKISSGTVSAEQTSNVKND